MPKDSVSETAGIPEDLTSESEEMYLLTVALAEEDGLQGSLPLAGLAQTLAVSAASANEMVRKLERRHLMSYEPYRGVRLTEEGRGVARRVLRVRRLWARLLADRLGMDPGEADSLACRLEHVTPAAVADRLDRFLEHPAAGAMERSMPPVGGLPPTSTVSLDRVDVGEEVEVVATDGDHQTVCFLASVGIRSGAVVKVRAHAGPRMLVAADGAVALDEEIAMCVQVREERRGG